MFDAVVDGILNGIGIVLLVLAFLVLVAVTCRVAGHHLRRGWESGRRRPVRRPLAPPPALPTVVLDTPEAIELEAQRIAAGGW